MVDVSKVIGLQDRGGVSISRQRTGLTTFNRGDTWVGEVSADVAYARGRNFAFRSREAAEAWVCEMLGIPRIDYAAMAEAQAEAVRKLREEDERANELARKVRAEFGEGA